MSELADLLDAYVGYHTGFGVPFVKADPVTDSEVAEVEAMLGVEVPAPVLELWRWSNGPGPIPGLDGPQPPLFLNGMHFASLGESARMVVETREWIHTEEHYDNDAIQAQFAPFPALMVANAFETLQAVVSLREEDAGSVWLWMHYGYGCRRCFDSVTDFVRLQVGFYEVGAVTVPSYPHPDLGFPKAILRPPDDPVYEGLDMPDPWLATWYPRAWYTGQDDAS